MDWYDKFFRDNNTDFNHVLCDTPLDCNSGGGLDVSTVTNGKIARVNIWNYEMTVDQVENLTCDRKGNVVNMDTLQINGPAAYQSEFLFYLHGTGLS